MEKKYPEGSNISASWVMAVCTSATLASQKPGENSRSSAIQC